jgi:hypothetical protein
MKIPMVLTSHDVLGNHRSTRILLQLGQADRFGLPLAGRASSRDLPGRPASRMS